MTYGKVTLDILVPTNNAWELSISICEKKQWMNSFEEIDPNNIHMSDFEEICSRFIESLGTQN